MYKTKDNKKVWIEQYFHEGIGWIIVHENGFRVSMPEHITHEQSFEIAYTIFPMDEELTEEYNEYLNEKNSYRGQY